MTIKREEDEKEIILPVSSLTKVSSNKWILLINDNVRGSVAHKDLNKAKDLLYDNEDSDGSKPYSICISSGTIANECNGYTGFELYCNNTDIQDISLACDDCHGMAFVITEKKFIEISY